jgi:predicted nicotinamide N-methyase
MPTIIIKREKEKGDLTLELKDPDFDVYRMAIMAYQGATGASRDKLAAGKIVLELCCTSGLPEVKKDKKAFISACMDAVDLLEFYDTEVKKN